MADIKKWELKMQEKRKNTPWREFLMEICSWTPLVFYRNDKYISKFPVGNRSQITSFSDFESERENLNKNTIDENDFLQQFGELFKTSKLSPMAQRGSNENSDYADVVLNGRNAYLSLAIVNDVEDVLYSWSIKDHSSNIQNSVMVWKDCENIFFSTAIINSYNIFYSRFIDNCNNTWFSTNLIGCSECILCDNLENASYHIKNQKYEKDEYLKVKKELLADKNKFKLLLSGLNTKSNNILSESCSGNAIIESSNIQNAQYVFNVRDGRNLIFGGSTQGSEEIYDCIGFGSPWSKNICGGYSINGENIFCSVHSAGSSNIYYSYFLENCSFCLGCVGLKNKQFCILNKQYSKEERFELADKIFEHMDKEGSLGKFFPGSMNPFYFNDTAAYLIDDTFTKEEVTAQGYLRRDEEIKVDIPAGAEVVKTSELNSYQGFDSDGNWKIDPEILKKVIIDDKGNSYRIIKMEYDFLIKHGLPLPELHRLDRIKLGFRFK